MRAGRRAATRLLRPAAFGLAVSVVLLALAEGGLRLFGVVSTQQIRGADVETLSAQPGVYTPGQHVVNRDKPDLPHTVTINELGFRVPPQGAGRKGPAFRIVCLGDSFTFGAGVDDEETWPYQLDRRLTTMAPSIQVVNAGVPGFTIVDVRILVEEKLDLLEADAVLVQFTPNDISDLTKAEPIVRQMQAHAELKSRPLLGPTLRFLQKTALFTGLQRSLAWYRVHRGGNPAVPLVGEREALTGLPADRLWRQYEEELVALRGFLDEHGVLLALVNYPGYFQVEDGADDEPRERLRAIAARAGVAYLDLYDALREAAALGEKLYLLPVDEHPGPPAHRAAAGALAEFLRESWLPEGVFAASATTGAAGGRS